ncbi:MAG: dihydroneopterin aldolase [Gammaproteobacteria bacterium 28-57-27]|nr:MAG: dihydroneopterin aldolase [Gammaproteobacteria bacterium 28-57-27]
MDKVFIKALCIETIIGIYDWERATKQVVELDLEMAWDNRPPAASDDIALALDYEAVSNRMRQFAGERQFLLVETMAEEIAAIVLQEFHSPWVRVRVTKPGAIDGAAGVGVQIERGMR